MSQLPFRRVFLATLLITSATLSACAPLARVADSPTATPEPEIATADAATAAASLLAGDAAVDASDSGVSEITLSVSRVGPAPDAHEDIFDRIRAGFQLEDADARAIDQQVRWYVSHPPYLERTFGRGEAYLHHIVSELESRGMPLELALLPVVESAFEPFGYSHARAAGLWQFIAGTGKRFGLKQNWWYDGRRDVLESTRAAMDYLQFLHQEFNGDWLLAVAAYNCGEAAVLRAIRHNLDTGQPTDFWHLKLPRETRAYVPKLLAMRRIVAQPGDYGLEFSVIPNAPYFAVVDTGGQIDLKMASELAGITWDELSNLNPAFNRWATDPDGPHRLLLPVEASEPFLESLAQVPADQRIRLTRYQVASGDTLSTIARKFGTSIAVLKQVNGLESNRLRAGQDLLMPAAGSALPMKVAMAAARVDGRAPAKRRAFHVVRRGESLWTIARRNGVDVRTLASWNGMQPGDVLPAGRKLVLRAGAGKSQPAVAGSGVQTTYTVRRGDTLSHIARRFGLSVTQLLSWNGLGRNHTLMPGQRLVMYVKGGAA